MERVRYLSYNFMKKIKVLMLEDSILDEELIKLELNKSNLNYTSIRVDNEPEFSRALDQYNPDLILSDFSLPQFNGLEALEIAKKILPNIPFVIVTGSLSEEVAADCIKSGAWDYVVKERLFRLSSVVINVLKIKDQKDRAREAIEKRKKYEFIINASPFPLSLINTNFEFEAINKAYCNFYGIEYDKLINKSVQKIWGSKFDSSIKSVLQNCLNGNKIKIDDWITPPNSGRKRYLEVVFTPYSSLNNDKITHIVVATHDITKLKQAQNKIKDSEKKFRFLAENSIDVLWQLDRKFNFTYASPSILDILGYSQEEILNINYKSICSEIEYERFLSYNQRSIANLKQTNLSTLETVLIHKDGGKIAIEINAKILINDKEQLIGLQGAFRDIRIRKSNEAQIQKLNTAVTQSPNSIMITDLNGDIEYVNPEFTKITGYRLSEILGENPRFLKTGYTNDDEYSKLWSTIKKGDVWEGEFKNKKKDGTTYWESAKISPIRNKEGKTINYIGVKENITERKMAEFALKENEQKLRTILDYSPVAIFQYDFSRLKSFVRKLFNDLGNKDQTNFKKTRRITLRALNLLKLESMNKAAEEIFGFHTIEEVLVNRDKIFTEDAITHFAKGIFTLSNNSTSYEFTSKFRNKAGDLKICLVRLATTPDLGFEHKLVIATVLDLTEREEIQKELEKSLNEKEIMLKEIHHRVKNNLQIISSMLNMQRREIEDKESLRYFLDSINRVKSMALIHDNMYHSENLEAIDVNVYVKKLFRFLLSNLNKINNGLVLNSNIENIQIDINKAIPLGLIINEILSNCIKHAYNGDSGEIELTFYKSNNSHFLTIKDNGIGIKGEIDLVNPNTLGLQLVQALSQQLHGKLKIESTLGTTFTLKF